MRKLLPVLILTVVAAATGVPFLLLPAYDVEVLNPTVERRPSPRLLQGVRFQQTVTVRTDRLKDDGEACIAVSIATYYDTTTGGVRLSLSDANGLLARTELTGAQLRDNAYNPVCAQLNAQDTVVLTLEGLGDQAEAAPSVWLTSDVSKGHIDGQPQEGLELQVWYPAGVTAATSFKSETGGLALAATSLLASLVAAFFILRRDGKACP